MDFQDTPAEAAFRAEVRAWLETAAAEYKTPPAVPYSEEEYVRRARAWLKTKSEGGYGAILWPKSVGGRGGTPIEKVIYEEEEGRYYVPIGAYVNIGLNNSLPAVIHHGRPDQIEQFAGPTMRGEIAWAQFFSEPGAGSDLAALRTRAVKDGDEWVVNGQKVWSSWAHHADWAILLARTDPSVAKHKGLTFFVVDVNTPGIDIRPIKQISGKSDFNETFLTDVRIPDSNRIGAVNGGWGVAMTVLTGERIGPAPPITGISSRTILRRAAGTPWGAGNLLDDSSAVRERIAKWYALEQGLRNFRFRMLSKLSKNEDPGNATGIAKAVSYRKLQDVAAFAMDQQGFAGLFDDGQDPEQTKVHDEFIWSSAMRLAGGSDEVLRNQLAERALGLPQDPRADKNIPFDQLPA
jgi:alkylation response protein AidB-like acyl-CoA dehydrogenase